MEFFNFYGEENKNDLLDRWMQGLELAKESLYAISGFGDGSHVQYFLDALLKRDLFFGSGRGSGFTQRNPFQI